jgi:N-acetylglutamate synthase-like GNAT family acetyltransferase
VKIELMEPRTDQEFEDYYRLRYERLRKPHGLSLGSERDHPAEASSIHVIAKADGRVVGAGCWVVGMRKDEQTGARQVFARFRQLAIDHDFDNRGIGVALLRYMEKAARQTGAKEIVGNVRVERVSYFERLGYVVNGRGETLYGNVEHMSMVKPLS